MFRILLICFVHFEVTSKRFLQVQQQRPQPPANYPQYHNQPKVPVQSNADFLRPVSDPRSPGHVQFESMVQMPNYLQYPGGNNWGQPPISQQNIQQQYQGKKYVFTNVFINHEICL